MPNVDKVLDNKIRRMIYNLIANYPGVPFNKLKDIFELTDSNLRYHLNYLEKNDKISSGIDNGIKLYYPHPSSVKILNTPQDIIVSQKLTQEQKHIVSIVKEYPGIGQKELINRSGIKHATAIRNINALKNLNLIKNHKFQKNVCYEYMPDVEMKFTIIKGLIIKFLRKEIDEETFLRIKRSLE
jgi:predicted transcriptional regulator